MKYDPRRINFYREHPYTLHKGQSIIEVKVGVQKAQKINGKVGQQEAKERRMV